MTHLFTSNNAVVDEGENENVMTSSSRCHSLCHSHDDDIIGQQWRRS